MKYVCVHVCVHACVNMCVHAACGLCLLSLHGEPCDFSTLFSVSMATHETVCCTCDWSSKLAIIMVIMEHLRYKAFLCLEL